MNQIELLLRLSENAQDQGDELAKRHNLERMTLGKDLVELYRMIELAKENVESEMRRWSLPLPEMPKLKPQPPEQPPRQLPNAPKPAVPRFLKPGGNSAAPTGVESRDDQPEHQRAAPPR